MHYAITEHTCCAAALTKLVRTGTVHWDGLTCTFYIVYHDRSAKLLAFSADLKDQLRGSQRREFERLLDTEAKEFMVATIHLRNAFDLR